MIQLVSKHNSISSSSSVLLNAFIFIMSISMVHSASPYKSDVTADEMRLTNSNLINDLVQYLKDASTFNERFRHSQCCPELGYYLNGQESRSASSLPSPSSSPSLSALLFSGSSSSNQPSMDKRMGSEFLGKRVGSEFLVETLNPLDLSFNSNFEQPEVPPKRYSEFLGGPGKRVSEFLGGPGKRSPIYGYVNDQTKPGRPQSVYYLAKKLSEILRASNMPNLGPYRPGGSEFLGGPGRR